MIRDMIIGDFVEKRVVGIRDIQTRENKTKCVVYDRSGQMAASIKRGSGEIPSVACISGYVIKGNGLEPLLNITEYQKAERYDPAEIYQGLSKEAEKYCLDTIGKAAHWAASQDASAAKILKRYLTKEELRFLAAVPATASYHGRYGGGALQSIALLVSLSRDIAVEHDRFDNGIYHMEPLCKSILITAALLTGCGLKGYLMPDGRRLVEGVERGYMSMCQSRIEELGGDVPREYVSRLINILTCCVSSRTGIRATSREGIVLRYAYRMMSEMDRVDHYLSKNPLEEGKLHAYCGEIGRFIVEMDEEVFYGSKGEGDV